MKRILLFLLLFTVLKSQNLDSLLIVEKKEKNSSRKFELLRQIAQLYRNYDLDSSLFFFKRALAFAPTDSHYTDIVRNIGISFFYKNAFDSAHYYYETSLKKARKIGYQKGIFKGYNSLGVLFRRLGKLQEAIAYYRKALEIARTSKDLKSEARIYNNLGIIYLSTGELEKAREYYQKAINLYKQTNDEKYIANCYNNLGLVYAYLGNWKQSKHYYDKAAEIFLKLQMYPQAAKAYNNLALFYKEQGNLLRAIDYHYKALEIYDKTDDTEGKAVIYNNIANIYIQQEDYKNSEKFYNKALKLYEKSQNQEGIGEVYNNLGQLYFQKNKLEKALEFYKKALDIFRKSQNKKHIPVTLNNIADVYVAQSKIQQALPLYKEALRISGEINSVSSKATALKGIGKILLVKKQFAPAYTYLQQALNLSYETGDLELRENVLELLTDYYYNLQNYRKAFEVQNRLHKLKDSLKNKKYKELLVSRSLKLQYEKEKELQEARHLAELEKQKLLAKEQEEKQRIITLSISAILGLLIVFFVILFNRYRFIRKQNRIITLQKQELEQQKEELQTLNENLRSKNEEINQQAEELRVLNEMLSAQKAEIEQKNKDLMASIQYAYRLQKTLIEASDVFRKFLPPHFLFFAPRDILSGDFYWIYKTEEYAYIAVADCTGHGVPGALISILGMEFLNQIMQQYENPAPNEILNRLREKVIERFHGKNSPGQHRDGMDISIVRIKGKEVQFAAANNPLYILTYDKEHYPQELLASEFSENDNTCVLQINGDKMPVGYSENLIPFSLKTLRMREGDEIILLSDGFQDQFGGSRNKKLGRKNLKKILLKLYSLPMSEQRKFLQEFLKNWKGKNHQTDDITILGAQI